MSQNLTLSVQALTTPTGALNDLGVIHREAHYTQTRPATAICFWSFRLGNEGLDLVHLNSSPHRNSIEILTDRGR